MRSLGLNELYNSKLQRGDTTSEAAENIVAARAPPAQLPHRRANR